MPSVQRWSDTDEVILSGLSAGMTHGEAAALASVSAKTVQRRLRDEGFADEVARRRSDQVVRLTGRLAALSFRAVDVLDGSINDDSPALRLRAADLTLTWLLRVRREADLERRITEIEQQLTNDPTRSAL